MGNKGLALKRGWCCSDVLVLVVVVITVRLLHTIRVVNGLFKLIIPTCNLTLRHTFEEVSKIFLTLKNSATTCHHTTR
jgi:hypothetical protein